MSLNMLTEVNNFYKKVEELRGKSPVYPLIYLQVEEDAIYLSSIIEFKDRGDKYKRHHLEYTSLKGSDGLLIDSLYSLTARFKKACELTIKLGRATSHDELIT